MIRGNIKRSLVPALASATLFFGQANEKSAALSQKDADLAVQQFEAEYVNAYNHKDAKAVAALFTESGTEFDEFGAVTQGRFEIEKALAAGFALPLKWKTEDTPKYTAALTSDVIVTQGTSRRIPDAGSEPPQTFLYTKVLIRQRDRWRLATVQYATSPSRYVGTRARPKTTR